MQRTPEFRDLLRRPRGIHFNSSIFAILRVTSDTDLRRPKLRKDSKSYALHASRNKPTPRLMPHAW